MKKKKKERKIALEDKAPVSTLATRVPIYIPYRTRPRRWNYFSWSSIGLKVNPWEGISPIYLNKAENLCCLFICFLAEKKKKKKTPSESFDDSIGALCSPRIIHSDPWKLRWQTKIGPLCFPFSFSTGAESTSCRAVFSITNTNLQQYATSFHTPLRHCTNGMYRIGVVLGVRSRVCHD